MASDETIYAAVVAEIEQGHIDKVLWAKAFANSGGAEASTKSLYVQYRVEHLSDKARAQKLQSVISSSRDVVVDLILSIICGLIGACLLPLFLAGFPNDPSYVALFGIGTFVFFVSFPFAFIHFRQVRRRRIDSKHVTPDDHGS